MKTLIFKTPIGTEEELVARIIAAADHIQNIPEVRLRQSAMSSLRRSYWKKIGTFITNKSALLSCKFSAT